MKKHLSEGLFRFLDITARFWFSGVLVLLCGFGYLLYGLIFVLRVVQVKKVIIILALFPLVLFGLAYYLLAPMGPVGDPVELVVVKGMTPTAVSRTLLEEGVIRHERAFRFIAEKQGYSRRMKAGKIVFYKNEGALNAARRLPDAVPVEKTITIPEGLTIWETARRFAREFPIDSSDFVNLCTDRDFITKLGISAPTLEGYLFPETYRFLPELTAEEAITRMVKSLTDFYEANRSESKGVLVNLHQVLTLASIVEDEAQVPGEQARIAGVFHNRLRQGWPIGADATVRYAIRKFEGPLRVSELKNPSPYNTRLHKGLPPGPISSPGRGAILATMNPMKTDEMFFVAKWDGSGEHDFSVSYREHDRKKLAIRKENEKRQKSKKGE